MLPIPMPRAICPNAFSAGGPGPSGFNHHRQKEDVLGLARSRRVQVSTFVVCVSYSSHGVSMGFPWGFPWDLHVISMGVFHEVSKKL